MAETEQKLIHFQKPRIRYWEMGTDRAVAEFLPTPRNRLDGTGTTLLPSLLLWKNRHRNPSMTEHITQADHDAFWACMDYQDITPEVRVVPHRKGGLLVLLADAASEVMMDTQKGYCTNPGNAIKPIENNEADHAKAMHAVEVGKMRDSARELARTIRGMMQSGTFSNDVLTEAATVLEGLSDELR